MKIKELLFDRKTISFLHTIKKECSSFIQDSTLPLYRGSWTDNVVYFLDKRSDRRPRDSAKDVIFNNLFNITIEHLFGVPKIRTKSIFVTKNWSQAHYYGEASYVFPQNGYKLAYGKRIHDSFEDVTNEQSLKPLFDWFDNNDHDTLEKFKNFFNHDEQKINLFYNYAKQFKSEYGYELTSSIKDAEKDFNRSLGEILILDAGIYAVNCKSAAKLLGIKDTATADFENIVYKSLLEKINAL